MTVQTSCSTGISARQSKSNLETIRRTMSFRITAMDSGGSYEHPNQSCSGVRERIDPDGY
jgi:hypothetical protein